MRLEGGSIASVISSSASVSFASGEIDSSSVIDFSAFSGTSLSEVFILDELILKELHVLSFNDGVGAMIQKSANITIFSKNQKTHTCWP